MNKKYAILLAAGLSIAATSFAADNQALPPIKKQPTPENVLAEHLDALNQCDWNRLVAQYPEDAEIHLPDGVMLKGRQKVGDDATHSRC